MAAPVGPAAALAPQATARPPPSFLPTSLDEELDSMFMCPELYDEDPERVVAVAFGEEWPEIPDDGPSQERLLQDANQARVRLLSRQSTEIDTTPADAWSAPRHVEPDHSSTTKSTRERRTEMIKQMRNDIACAFCGSLFPDEALDECAVCEKLFCYECVGAAQFCKLCRGWDD